MGATLKRLDIRVAKKLLHGGTGAGATDQQREWAVGSALALLSRSVRMRHHRLALRRLSEAVELGAAVPNDHWAYCREVAAVSQDPVVRALFEQSEQASHGFRCGRPQQVVTKVPIEDSRRFSLEYVSARVQSRWEHGS